MFLALIIGAIIAGWFIPYWPGSWQHRLGLTFTFLVGTATAMAVYHSWGTPLFGWKLSGFGLIIVVFYLSLYLRQWLNRWDNEEETGLLQRMINNGGK
jgi:membrane protein implicated in regulation of membrane protease activity